MLIQLRVFLVFAVLLSGQANAGSLTDKICEFLLLKRKAKVVAPVAEPTVVKKPEFNLWIDPQYEDPDWVMAEARKTYQELEALPQDQKQKKHILYFQKQMPLLIRLLREIRVPASAKYWMVDQFGQRIHNDVETIQQAVDVLIKEGQQHYFDKNVTHEWFPQYVMEVIGLRWFTHQVATVKWQMPTHEEFRVWYDKLRAQKAYGVLNENPYWYLLHMLRNKRTLQDERALGALHWPTIAKLNMIHFDDWHLEIKPLGYTTTIEAWTDGVQTDVFDLFDHDLDFHRLPDKFRPYKNEFARFKAIYDAKAAQEKMDQQVLLRLLWFQATHENSALYSLFVEFMQIPEFDILDKVEAMFEHFLWGQYEANNFAQPDNKKISGELTTSLKTMSSDKRREETQQAFVAFKRHLIHSLQEFKLQK